MPKVRGTELSQLLPVRLLNFGIAKAAMCRDTWLHSTDIHSRHEMGYAFEENAPFIARLPVEILVLIFEQGHEGRFTSFSHNVSSVCRYWRALAVDTPSLWSPILFFEDDHPDYLERARCYLERSKSFPVDIFMCCGMGKVLQKFWHILVPHLRHCRSLSVAGDGGSLYADIERLGAIETPLLQSLELTNTFSYIDPAVGTWSTPPPRPLFSSSNLHTVRMDMIQVHDIDTTRYFCLENVTNFWFRWQLPTEDHIDGGSEEMTVDTHVPRMIEAMPKLRELTLTCWDTTSYASLVPLLDKLPPSLVFLELSGISVAWDIKYGIWQCRDLSRLHTIKLSFSATVNPFDADLFALLRMMPNLQELYLGVVELRHHPKGPVQPLRLNHLERLTLDWVGEHTLDVFLHNLEAPALTKATILTPFQFDLPVTKDDSDVDIPALWRSCPRIESLTLSHGCTLSRNGDLVTALRDFLKNVRSLDLRGQSKWDDGLLRGLSTAPWPCPSLEAISLAYMPDLTQEALESFLRARKRGSLAGDCAALTRIGIRGCSRLRVTEILQETVCEVWHWI